MAKNNMINTRIIHKHDTEAHWLLAVNFIPEQGELIVYDRDMNYNYERFKIGDGQTVVSALPFTTNIYIQPTAPINAKAGTLWVDTSI